MTDFDEYGNKKDDVSFKRPANKEDIKYRKTVQVTFEKRLKEIVGKDFELCFHGTPIWNAIEIVKSGNITALIDRVGAGEYVIPNPGKISVSTINNIWFTLKYHTDLYNYNYPAGCIFVIEPKDADELKSAKEHSIINNIYFTKEPTRLKAIITTPENIQTIKRCVEQSNLDIDGNIVVDFEEFLVVLNKENENLNTLV